MPHEVQPYYLRDPQPWAVEQERLRHNEAMYHVGEMCMFTLMWHVLDFEAGLVARCNRCFVARGKVAEAYGQASQNKCPDCFGTTFEGGFRAQIVRPAIFTDTDEDERPDRRGVIHPNDVGLETTTDFRVRQGDFAFRADGTRWYLRGPERVTLRAGFGYPGQRDEAVGYNHAKVTVEDPDSVAYLIPPATATVKTILGQYRRTPQDYSAYEIIRAPLIPASEP
jgi:hypothetical protein